MTDLDLTTCRKLPRCSMNGGATIIDNSNLREEERLVHERDLLVHEAFVTFGNPLQSIYHGVLSFVLQARLYGLSRSFRSLVDFYNLI